MKSKIIAIASLLGLLSVNLVQAASPQSFPARGTEVAPNVFSLGSAYDAQSDSLVQGYAIVHKKGQARSGNAQGPKGNTCYGFLATGAKWKSVENWTVFGGAGLNASFVLENTSANITKWEQAAGTLNILGTGSVSSALSPSDPYTLDNKNEVSFGNLDSGTIAVTVVWGIFSGPTFGRELVAWDQVFNTDYAWAEDATGSSTQMDFPNISTHELGHAVGMGDIYSPSCAQVTMYGYADYGETNKRSLETPDIVGVSTLY